MKCEVLGCEKEAECFRLVELNDFPMDMETNFCVEHDVKRFSESYEEYLKKGQEYLASCGLTKVGRKGIP